MESKTHFFSVDPIFWADFTQNLGAAYAWATGGVFAAAQSAGAASITMATGAAHVSSGERKRKCERGDDDYCH